MYDQRVTISEAVDHIQKQEYLLPAIQREIVWKRDQITDLFDSVLRGYPIGTFLFWDIEDEYRDQYTMYGFIQDYITNTKYIETDAQKRNSKVNPDGVGDLKLILDGQQRLSSFYIGLKGTYTYKQPYKWYRNEDAWNRSRLYFHLTSNPWEETEAGGDRQMRYEFEFLPEDRYDGEIVERGENEYWMRAGVILNYPESRDLGKYISDLRSRLDLSPEQEEWLAQNLRDYRTAIHEQKYITYFEEKEQDIDRVLEIFIRTNDGGTQLRKSDLLLSIAQANWTEYEAREELTSFVDHLNTQLPGTNNYTKDFLLKSCLVLSDLPVRYRVSQFKRDNVDAIEREWPEIRRAIEEAARLVNYFGVTQGTLLSRNGVIPLAYYFKETGLRAEDFHTNEADRSQTKRDVKRWFLATQLHGTFSGSADSVLRRTRQVLRNTDGDGFPVTELNESIADLGKVVGFDAEVADNVLEYTKGGKRTFLALTLLYDQHDFGTVQYHQDHVFPTSRLTEENLVERGLSRSRAQELVERADTLPNLQLLTASENERKQDLPFEEWIATRDDEYYSKHYIPDDPELYRVENFEEFIEARGSLIKERLVSQLGRSQRTPADD